MKAAFLYSFVFLYLYANVVSMTAESKSVTNLGTIMVNYVSPAADLHTSMWILPKTGRIIVCVNQADKNVFVALAVA